MNNKERRWWLRELEGNVKCSLVAVYFYLINSTSSIGDINKNYVGVNYVPPESENIEVIINEGVNSVVPDSENIEMVIKISKILKSLVL